MSEHPWLSMPRFPVAVNQFRQFHEDGFLIVKGLMLPEHVAEIKDFSEDLIYGRRSIEGVDPPNPGDSPSDMEKRLLRLHMLHFVDELSERFLLYPRILDVVEALHGPDILALQTMMFFRGPGSNGQGWHQDSYYIPTFPDSLIGAWVAIDPAREDNGCMWMIRGSQSEPVYPPKTGHGHGHWYLDGIQRVGGVGGQSNSDEDPANDLQPIANGMKDRMICCDMEPGDVAFFGGRIMHRSYSNRTPDRMRRAFVSHYCNARSFTPWFNGNSNQILARGNTTLGFSTPKFGTPCSAQNPSPSVSDRGSEPNEALDFLLNLLPFESS